MTVSSISFKRVWSLQPWIRSNGHIDTEATNNKHVQCLLQPHWSGHTCIFQSEHACIFENASQVRLIANNYNIQGSVN